MDSSSASLISELLGEHVLVVRVAAGAGDECGDVGECGCVECVEFIVDAGLRELHDVGEGLLECFDVWRGCGGYAVGRCFELGDELGVEVVLEAPGAGVAGDGSVEGAGCGCERIGGVGGDEGEEVLPEASFDFAQSFFDFDAHGCLFAVEVLADLLVAHAFMGERPIGSAGDTEPDCLRVEAGLPVGRSPDVDDGAVDEGLRVGGQGMRV